MKKRNLMTLVSTFLLTFTIMAPTNASLWFIGEPALPRQLNRLNKDR